jgi:hypothetical protein
MLCQLVRFDGVIVRPYKTHLGERLQVSSHIGEWRTNLGGYSGSVRGAPGEHAQDVQPSFARQAAQELRQIGRPDGVDTGGLLPELKWGHSAFAIRRHQPLLFVR